MKLGLLSASILSPFCCRFVSLGMKIATRTCPFSPHALLMNESEVLRTRYLSSLPESGLFRRGRGTERLPRHFPTAGNADLPIQFLHISAAGDSGIGTDITSWPSAITMPSHRPASMAVRSRKGQRVGPLLR